MIRQKNGIKVLQASFDFFFHSVIQIFISELPYIFITLYIFTEIEQQCHSNSLEIRKIQGQETDFFFRS